ncbi:uncharacterized protein [Labrus bergylta]|uniref:uncharacterized protein n=1 Tax=Labrus bergylta TaxID=56723 RepID=UPI003313DB77
MSAVERRGAPDLHWENRPFRNQDFKRHRSLVSRSRLPLSRSTWLPDGPRATHHAQRGPVYVSFVSKAVLWDRGFCQQVAHDHPDHRPLFCPRFLSHMKARPEDLRPPRFLSSKSRQQPSSQGRKSIAHTLTALKTQTLEGNFQLPDRRRNVVPNQVGGRRSAVVVPCLPLAASPPSVKLSPSPPHQNTPHLDSNKPDTVQTSPPSPHSAPEENDDVQEREKSPPQPDLVSITEPDLNEGLGPPGTDRSLSPTSVVSDGSLSDFSRPHSSLFSRSTDLASGRSSVLSGDITDLEASVCLSPLHPRSAMSSPSAPNSPAGFTPRQSAMNTTATSKLYEPETDSCKPVLSRSASVVNSQTSKPPSRCESLTENQHQAASTDPALNPHLDSDPGLVTLAFPSATWSSCPSPLGSTPPSSGSGPKLTPTASVTRLESHRWPVLPPISPVRGRCGSAASRYSELSCTQSRVFDELEAVAPRSASGRSLDEAFDSSCRSSPDRELSLGLAALTVGCDSGNLGSISRVQLLLLDRNEPETLPSPSGYEDELSLEEDWSDMRMLDDPELTSAGVSRPLTAGSGSERCDSAGKVHENKSDQSEGCSGSPSSWIIDPSPSHNMFTSADSPSFSADDGGLTEEDSDHSGRRDQIETPTGERRPHLSPEEKERRMEEKKTKALSMLSKLQDDAPRQAKSSKGRSNFEDFDFLAKFCIFSQEKLAEYKRAFEAEDGDGDGYISCLQVLLALKNILPAELLSEEEEIFVYRILEMVDFRVTDGLVDLRLFAVITSLAQKIASMDEFMRSLISDMDFRSLEVRLFKAKQLFLFLLDEQRGDSAAQQGFISAEQLLLELKAGGIQLEHEAAVRLELQHIPPLDLLDFLAYLPLFMLIHKSVISNPLDSSGNL